MTYSEFMNRELKKAKRAALKTALYRAPGIILIALSTVGLAFELFNGEMNPTNIAFSLAFAAIGYTLITSGDLATSDYALRQIWEKLNQIESGLAVTFGWTPISDESSDDKNSDETHEQTSKTQ